MCFNINIKFNNQSLKLPSICKYYEISILRRANKNLYFITNFYKDKIYALTQIKKKRKHRKAGSKNRKKQILLRSKYLEHYIKETVAPL